MKATECYLPIVPFIILYKEDFFLLIVWMKLQLRPYRIRSSLCCYLHAIENDSNYLSVRTFCTKLIGSIQHLDTIRLSPPYPYNLW